MVKATRGRIHAQAQIEAKVIRKDGSTEIHKAKFDNRPWYKKILDYLRGK